MDKTALYTDEWEQAQQRSMQQQSSAGDRVTISREAIELLRLKDRAMDNTKEGITIADCSQPDMPLIYANEAFARITGYSVAESLGKNCRFLQVCRTWHCVYWFALGQSARHFASHTLAVEESSFGQAVPGHYVWLHAMRLGSVFC